MKENYGTIHFIITGGTIDSRFNPAKDSIEIGNKTSVPEYLEKLKLHNKFEFTELFMKDSREIRYKDREKLLKTIDESAHRMIIVTHGTYTMPDTAQYLKDHLSKKDKTIVVTGSMVPLRGFDFSDAAFNLGYAIANVQKLAPGVYICMNGKVFDPDKVDKNKVDARFEEVKD